MRIIFLLKEDIRYTGYMGGEKAHASNSQNYCGNAFCREWLRRILQYPVISWISGFIEQGRMGRCFTSSWGRESNCEFLFVLLIAVSHTTILVKGLILDRCLVEKCWKNFEDVLYVALMLSIEKNFLSFKNMIITGGFRKLLKNWPFGGVIFI